MPSFDHLPAERKLALPRGMTLDTLLTEAPDEPLPNLAGFDRLYQDADQLRHKRLCHWIESQQTVDMVIKHHGQRGLNRVLRGIAKACSENKVTMTPRVRSIAEFYELQTY